jgi:GAF domain-containing protein
MSALPDIPDSIAEAIATGNTPHVLDATLQHFHCQAGTIHRMGPVGKLELIAHSGIPPEVVQIVEFVPLGKGIAGLAAERRAPVTICNLQSDTSGQARPGAKATGMEGSIAVPMLIEDELRGVLGIAKANAYDWSAEETALLLAIGSQLASVF